MGPRGSSNVGEKLHGLKGPMLAIQEQCLVSSQTVDILRSKWTQSNLDLLRHHLSVPVTHSPPQILL